MEEKKKVNETETSFFSELAKPFHVMEKETWEKKGDRCILWEEWAYYWFRLYVDLPIYTRLTKDNKLEFIPELKSLFYYRYVGLFYNLLWVNICVMSGFYHTAIRELRFIFESILQAYYIDKINPDKGIEHKLKKIEEWDRSEQFYKYQGRRLISKLKDELKLEENTCRKLRLLYSDLCGYAHSSIEELGVIVKEISERGKVGPPAIKLRYYGDLFDKCHDFTNRVMDAIIFVLMSFRSEVITEVREKKEDVLSFLEENNCELSLGLLNQK